MGAINNQSLRNVYYHLITIEEVIRKEASLVRGNKSYLDKIVPEELSKVYSIKEKTALGFIDDIVRINYEMSVIALVAEFERIVFAKYRTSYGTLKSVIKTNSSKPLDYYESRERFIHDKIDKLSGILALLEGIINTELYGKINSIKEHRNYIAHGKRDSKAPAYEYSIREIASILDEAIREIEK